MDVYVIENKTNKTYDEVRCAKIAMDGDVIQFCNEKGNVTLIYKMVPGDYITYSHEE